MHSLCFLHDYIYPFSQRINIYRIRSSGWKWKWKLSDHGAIPWCNCFTHYKWICAMQHSLLFHRRISHRDLWCSDVMIVAACRGHRWSYSKDLCLNESIRVVYRAQDRCPFSISPSISFSLTDAWGRPPPALLCLSILLPEGDSEGLQQFPENIWLKLLMFRWPEPSCGFHVWTVRVETFNKAQHLNPLDPEFYHCQCLWARHQIKTDLSLSFCCVLSSQTDTVSCHSLLLRMCVCVTVLSVSVWQRVQRSVLSGTWRLLLSLWVCVGGAAFTASPLRGFKDPRAEHLCPGSAGCSVSSLDHMWPLHYFPRKRQCGWWQTRFGPVHFVMGSFRTAVKTRSGP